MKNQKVICDTNIFISMFTGHEPTIEVMKEIGIENILMPSVCLMELFCGMSNKKEMARMAKNVKQFNVLHLNEKASSKAIELIQTYRLSHGLAIPDCLIAAMALSYELPLFTYNVKDFHFLPNIELYNLRN